MSSRFNIKYEVPLDDEDAQSSSDSASLRSLSDENSSSANISLGDEYELSAMGDLSLSEGYVLSPGVEQNEEKDEGRDTVPSPRKPRFCSSPRKPHSSARYTSSADRIFDEFGMGECAVEFAQKRAHERARQPSLRMKIARPTRPSLRGRTTAEVSRESAPIRNASTPSFQPKTVELEKNSSAGGRTSDGPRKRTTPDFRALVENLRAARERSPERRPDANASAKPGEEGWDTRAALREMLART